jgi:hypothetical protein
MLMGLLRMDRQARGEPISTSQVLHSTSIAMNLMGTRITITITLIITA